MCRMRREAAVPLVKRRPSEDLQSPAGKIRSAVRDVLERYPETTLRERIQRVEEHGLTLGTSNTARIRQELRGTKEYSRNTLSERSRSSMSVML